VKLIDLTGQRFGRLTVIERAPNSMHGHARWACRCDCSKTTVFTTSSLRPGKVKSCGCAKVERMKLLRRKHGDYLSSEYPIWLQMRARCRNRRDRRYKNYGARGIGVCERWDSFGLFMADMGPRPSPKHSIERKDVNGDYCPENCVWIELRLQSRNKRNTIFTQELVAQVRAARIAGENVSAWARERGIAEGTACNVARGIGWRD